MDLTIFDARIAGEQKKCVNLREIHEKVISGQEFANWAKSRLAACGAVEGRDYLVDNSVRQLPSGAKHQIDYHVTMDIAKHCAMLERNEQGFAVRQYLIDVEKGLHGNSKFLELLDDKYSQMIEEQFRQGKDLANVKRLVEDKLGEIAQNLKELVDKGREYPTTETMRIHGKVILHFYFGYCPFDEDVKIVDSDGNWILGRDTKRVADIHHQYNKNDARLEATIPLNRKAHQLIESNLMERRKLDDIFDKYQTNVARMMAQSKQLGLF